MSASEGASLLVSEIFGPTFQGEGPSLGRRCSFLRLGGCNLHCSYCDTPYTWDWAGRNGIKYLPSRELTRQSVDETWEGIQRMKTGMLVVTGGEPLLQQDTLVRLLAQAQAHGWRIEIETAGTIQPSSELVPVTDQFNVSPKLANSGNELHRRYQPTVIEALQATGRAVWKFVATGPADLDEIAELTSRHDLRPVYVMPEGVSADGVSDRLQTLAAGVLEHGWNLTTRLQILLYGNQRGV